jgi:hypothetical protein
MKRFRVMVPEREFVTVSARAVEIHDGVLLLIRDGDLAAAFAPGCWVYFTVEDAE